MIEKELQSYIREIRGMVPDSTWSDDALLALGACLVSLQNFVVANGTGEEYGNRKDYEQVLDLLCDILRERCEDLEAPLHSGLRSEEPLRDEEAFVRRSRLTVALYEMVHRSMRVAELEAVTDIRGRMCRLVSEWMERLSVAMPCGASSAEHDVLRCIAYLLCYEPEEEREKDNAWKYFRRRLSEETASQPQPGGVTSQSQPESLFDGDALQSLPEECALQHLSLLSLYADLFADVSLAGLVAKASDAYTRRLLPIIEDAVMDVDMHDNRSDVDAESPEGLEEISAGKTASYRLYKLYDLTMWGAGTPDPQTVDAIADLARQMLEADVACRPCAGHPSTGSAAVGNDAIAGRKSAEAAACATSAAALSEFRLWSLAILTDLACRRASADLEAEYFAYSA